MPRMKTTISAARMKPQVDRLRRTMVLSLSALLLYSSTPRANSASNLIAAAAQQNPRATHWNPSSLDDSWNYWWSYSGVSGPSNWGLLNTNWFMCDKGKRQSPINIDTRALAYDMRLRPLQFADNNLTTGLLYNNGHAIVFNGSLWPVAAAAAAEPQPVVGFEQLPEELEPEKRPVNQLQRNSSDSSQQSIGMLSAADLSPDQMLSWATAEPKLATDTPTDGQQPPGATPTPAAPEIVELTGGDLPYSYRFEMFYLRFGAYTGDESTNSSSSDGSEHRINSRAFAAELQLFAYNSNLYKNFDEAAQRPNGLLAIAVLIDLAPEVNGDGTKQVANQQLERLIQTHLPAVLFRGQSTFVGEPLKLSELLPTLDEFVTYDGSLTQPGCHESVRWILLNKPLYISSQSLEKLRLASADEQSIASTGTLVAGNIRPLQPSFGRPVRTSIRPPAKSAQSSTESCRQLSSKYEYSRKLV